MQSINISFSLDNFYSISNINQLNESSVFKNFSKGNSFYVRFLKSNEKSLDAGIFISPQNIAMQKSNAIKSLIIDFQIEEYIFAGVQVEKDANVTEKDHKEFVKNWYDRKEEISRLIKEMESNNEPKPIIFFFIYFL